MNIQTLNQTIKTLEGLRNAVGSFTRADVDLTLGLLRREVEPHTPPAAQPAPVQPMESLLAAIQAEPVTLIHKWRVLELVKEHAAQPASVQVDGEGENKAVRSFLMIYGQRGVTVGEMKRHMDRSGFKSWPTWVDADEMAKHHLTKAGAQLWLRHLFALEVTTPTAPVQTNWQPIEIAPKAGTICVGREFSPGRWSFNHAWFNSETEEWTDEFGDHVLSPTHWVPLPQTGEKQ